MQNETNHPLDPWFLELVACPACDPRAPLRQEAGQNRLICDRCGRTYPISGDIPDLVLRGDDVPQRDGTHDDTGH